MQEVELDVTFEWVAILFRIQICRVQTSAWRQATLTDVLFLCVWFSSVPAHKYLENTSNQTTIPNFYILAIPLFINIAMNRRCIIWYTESAIE